MYIGILAEGFFARLSQWNVITALVLAVSAFVLMLCTNALVAKLMPGKTDAERQNVSLKIKVGCAVTAVVACLLAVIF